ncbi:hypothetical protein BDN72DRAFT_855921 [Pluteus cervinus]|uniref:Uncharacterized protein n=1 Tax=Pluteus cervinus TaxID=181527 RepID=A0ACD3B0W5_9AGAR|nr:hypothetical protein BDN72DRAFT_855921 [Pluteus cervinus]
MASTPEGYTFPFLSLAVELRFMVYDIYLEGTIIRIPGPLPNALDLLPTCRLIYDEASPRVVSKATFSLWCTDDLISFLLSLPDEKLRALRHLAIWASPFGLYSQHPSRGYFTTHLLPRVLDCFPGLQLDTLVVRDGFHGPGINENHWRSQVPVKEVDRLLLEGNGWRELRYYTSYMVILDVDERGRLETWDEAMTERDGVGSGASVRILVGEEGGANYGDTTHTTAVGPGAIDSGGEEGEGISDIAWDQVDETVPWREENFTCHTPDDAVVSRFPMFERRPVVIVVKRGQDADISGGLFQMPQLIREILQKFTWKEMKKKDRMLGGPGQGLTGTM